MILRHFKLREQPFGVTPDPRYLFASATHREALSSLLYGVESGLGFVALTAKPGMGKTTLLFEVLRRLEKTAKTVFLFQSIDTPTDLVRALLIDLGVTNVEGSLAQLQARLNDALVAHSATGKRLVVAIDEAQHLDRSVLEAVRMLSNFETPSHKLMQIVLSGQPELAETLASPQLLQLRQRISIFGHLQPLSATETTAYVQHRLRVSGYESTEPIFTSSAMALIARHSEGIPRNINNICFNALSLACALQSKTVGADVIREVVADLDLSRHLEPIAPANAEPKRASIAKHRFRVVKPRLRVLSITAAICAIVLLFGWLGVEDYRALYVEGTVQANTSTMDASTKPSSSSAPVRFLAPASSSYTREVEVRAGQSLSDICAETFGGCRPDLLRELIRINPSIHNPDHIESGQRISIPNSLQTAVGGN